MKDRTLICKHYEAEGHCRLGKEGTLWKACVHCQKYDPVRGTQPIRKNLKRKKLSEIRRKEEE